MQPIVSELVYQPMNSAVLTIRGGQVTIHDQGLQNRLANAGIHIPFAFRPAYQGQSEVKIGDPLFCRAVRQLLELQGYRAPNYVWKETFNHESGSTASSERD